MKKFLPIIILIILILSLGAGLYLVKRNQDFKLSAAPSSNITLQASTSNPRPEEQFSVTAIISTGPNQVTGSELSISYPSDKLEVLSVNPGTFLANADVYGPIIDSIEGSVFYSLYLPVNDPPITGSGELATFIFKAKASGSATINIDDTSVVVAIGENGDNVLETKSGISVNVAQALGGASVTATPISTPGSTSTAIPTASASATAGPTYKPSPTSISQVPSDLPVTGVETPFIILIGAAVALFGTSYILINRHD